VVVLVTDKVDLGLHRTLGREHDVTLDKIVVILDFVIQSFNVLVVLVDADPSFERTLQARKSFLDQVKPCFSDI
jgi:hypothetical protein